MGVVLVRNQYDPTYQVQQLVNELRNKREFVVVQLQSGLQTQAGIQNVSDWFDNLLIEKCDPPCHWKITSKGSKGAFDFRGSQGRRSSRSIHWHVQY